MQPALSPHEDGVKEKGRKLKLTSLLSAQDWIRTSTWFPTLRPEHSASTNFATWAFRAANIGNCSHYFYTDASFAAKESAANTSGILKSG